MPSQSHEAQCIQPKERKLRTSTHEPSVKLSKRTFAVQDNAVEHVDIGSSAEASVCMY